MLIYCKSLVVTYFFVKSQKKYVPEHFFIKHDAGIVSKKSHLITKTASMIQKLRMVIEA